MTRNPPVGRNDLTGTAAGPDGTFEYRSPTKGEWEDVTYRVGGQYDLTDQTMLYTMYATGYQPGTICHAAQVIEKQTLEQWTAGVKTRCVRQPVAGQCRRFPLDVS